MYLKNKKKDVVNMSKYKTEVLNDGTYKGSTRSYLMVAEQIANRYGEQEVDNYDPYKNCLTFKKWNELGYKIKPGETAIKSLSYIKQKRIDTETGEEATYSFPRNVNLFYHLQVEKRSN